MEWSGEPFSIYCVNSVNCPTLTALWDGAFWDGALCLMEFRLRGLVFLSPAAEFKSARKYGNSQ